MATYEMNSLDVLPNVAADVLMHLTPSNTAATVLALHGDLGAGKTTFTQALARALSVSEPVTSPTFVIMKGYKLDEQPFTEIVHIDAYRLEHSDELRRLGFLNLLTQPRTLVLIEWAEKVRDLIPPTAHNLTFTLKGEAHSLTVIYAEEN